jgi:hypothetical protein
MDAPVEELVCKKYCAALFVTDPSRAQMLLGEILDGFRACAATQPEGGFCFSDTPISKLLEQVGPSASKSQLAFRFGRCVGELAERFQWLHDTGVQIGLLGWSDADKNKAKHRCARVIYSCASSLCTYL